MTQYSKLNITLSNSPLNKLKSGIKNETEVTLNLSSNLIKLIFKGFVNDLSTIIKCSKDQLSKMMQLGGFNFSDFLDLTDSKIYGTGITIKIMN